MKKFKTILSIVTAFVLGLVTLCLTACSSSSGLKSSDVKMSPKITASTVTLSITISENDNIKSGAAVPYVYEYVYNSTSDEYELSTNKKQQVTFSNNVYTSSTVKFTGLEADTEYRYIFKVTYNSYEEEITSLDVKTKQNSSSSDSTVITTAEEFLEIYDDPSGYFTLENDIDFEAEGVSLSSVTMFSASTPFTGTFMGNGHTIKNYTIPASNYMGLFNYCSNATISDLTVENAIVDLSTGRSSSAIGAVAGMVESSTITNVDVISCSFTFAGISTTKLYIGGAFGNVLTSTITNVNVYDADINVTRARLNVYMGLFAGEISGSNYNKASYLVKDSSATGNLTTTLYYTSSSDSTVGSLFLGGFVGNLTAIGLVTESYADSTIKVYKSDSSHGYANVEVGGFVGAGSGFNVSKCVAVTSIDINAGIITESSSEETTTTSTIETNAKLFDSLEDVTTTTDDVITTTTTTDEEETDSNDFSDTLLVLADYNVYVGGFVGFAPEPYAQLTDSFVIFKTETIYNAKKTDKTVIDDFAGYNGYEEGTRFNGCKVTNLASDYLNVFDADSSVYTYLTSKNYIA